MMTREYKRLKKIKQQAMDCVDQGNYRAARRELKKLERSLMVSEATQIKVEVQGTMLYRQEKVAEACELVKLNLGYLWGDPFAWMLTRQINAPVSTRSKRFTLKITGSGIGLGAFTYYPPEYYATFDVVAPSPEIALDYIRKVVNFESPDAIRIVSSGIFEHVPEEIEMEGVLWALPFSFSEDDTLGKAA